MLEAWKPLQELESAVFFERSLPLAQLGLARRCPRDNRADKGLDGVDRGPRNLVVLFVLGDAVVARVGGVGVTGLAQWAVKLGASEGCP